MKYITLFLMTALWTQITYAQNVSALCSSVGDYQTIETNYDGNADGTISLYALTTDGLVEEDEITGGYRYVDKAELLANPEWRRVIRAAGTDMEQVLYAHEFTLASSPYHGALRVITLEGHYTRIRTVLNVMGQTIRCR